MWSTTPLVLKATAGLRLLLPVEAENLLNEVRDVFLRSSFLVKDDSVEILDGIDEGIYSWFTINFLLGKISFFVNMKNQKLKKIKLNNEFFSKNRSFRY